MNFYGSTRWESGIEIPAHDQDFYALKDVPHGHVQQVLFPSKSTNSIIARPAYVYTPPDYDKDTTQALSRCCTCSTAGVKMNTAWWNQGRANLIMDNLIAEGKTKPFIIVMTYGMTNEGGRPGGGRGRGRTGRQPGGRTAQPLARDAATGGSSPRQRDGATCGTRRGGAPADAVPAAAAASTRHSRPFSSTN